MLDEVSLVTFGSMLG